MFLAKDMLESELIEWRTGNRKWNVHNQFNETILESALENLTQESLARANDIFKWAVEESVSTMDLANAIADFKAPEIDRAWVD